MQKAETGTQIAQRPAQPTNPEPPTAPKIPQPKDPTPPKRPKVPGTPFTPEEQNRFDQLREVMPDATEEDIDRVARQFGVAREEALRLLMETEIRRLNDLIDILKTPDRNR